jgi:hypothetical protein
MSLFSAEARPAGVHDLAGLLCGPGQIVRFGAGDQARLSIVLTDPAHAPAVVDACTAAGIPVEAVRTEHGTTRCARRSGATSSGWPASGRPAR